jgi:hypothetical protein
VIATFPEIRMVSTTVGDTGNGLRNSALLSIQLTRPSERKRTQKQVENALRTGAEAIPGISVSLGNLPIYVALLGPTRTCSRPRC